MEDWKVQRIDYKSGRALEIIKRREREGLTLEETEEVERLLNEIQMITLNWEKY